MTRGGRRRRWNWRLTTTDVNDAARQEDLGGQMTEKLQYQCSDPVHHLVDEGEREAVHHLVDDLEDQFEDAVEDLVTGSDPDDQPDFDGGDFDGGDFDGGDFDGGDFDGGDFDGGSWNDLSWGDDGGTWG